ncbi:ABC transporter ATP-binding protein [Mycoplasma sp. Mirounga ES2805-ORL]|uniref:ABC transporter ATP-binding protein n=1 Tax=Mycoplasma sp. Mirounga ES2805-ORL TaxID=754514 RepID=UPI00197C7BA5|nr:ABC transporter ATP-binding protein [Mycoplasma sp. Mirounga ES2805-ORL]QSF13729.1 ABC transporter ATP-binding protein [Mycoplasma sp. Mirounga ES2805-ORL]
MNENKQEYYCEKGKFNKKICRPIRKGVHEMLDSSSKKKIVEIRNLDIEYGFGAKKYTAIKDMNLNIYEGEVLGLVGESGSGKTTTGRAIIGLVPHNFGYIKILDRVIPKNIDKVHFGKYKKETIDFMVNKVQMIFQDPTNSLNPFKNVEQVIGEGLTNLKSSKDIYLSNIDQDTYLEINKKINEIDSKNPLTNNVWKDIRDNEKTTKDLYDFVNVKTLDILNERVKQNSQYQEIINFVSERKQFRDEESKLNEKQCKRKLIVDILSQVGLDETVLSRFPLEFSGGQQQRVGICRSVVLQPKLLIADEPISALDVSIQAQVINIFNELKERYHLTILFIAHDLRMVEYISDRIAVLNKGTLLEIGPTHEIMHNAHHPYTRSLLEAVPSIESKKGSLIGYVYDANMHNYSQEVQPSWQKINDEHFVLATDEEFKEFKKQAKLNNK